MKRGMHMSATMKGRLNLGIVFLAFLIYLLCSPFLKACYAEKSKPAAKSSKLFVLWTSGDKEVALPGPAFLYPTYSKSKGWWDEIRFIVFGPSEKLLAEDAEIQENIKKMQEAGVEVIACKWCADKYGITEKIESLGIKVFYVGEIMTEMLKGGWATLTF